MIFKNNLFQNFPIYILFKKCLMKVINKTYGIIYIYNFKCNQNVKIRKYKFKNYSYSSVLL